MALFYFAGHGTVTKFGGYLMMQDFKENDEGVAMLNVLNPANQFEIAEVLLIRDCCHNGVLRLIPVLQSQQTHFARRRLNSLRQSRFAVDG